MGRLVCLFGVFVIGWVSARDLVVDQKNGPYKTIQACVNDAKPGDSCKLKAGNYHEPTIHINGKKGSADKPIVIEAFDDDRPVLDGTEVLHFEKEAAAGNEEQPENWEEWDNEDEAGNEDAYVAKYIGVADSAGKLHMKDFWQLFYDEDLDTGDGERIMLTNARWPNAPWDESKEDMPIFDGKNWAYLETTSSIPKIPQDRENTIVLAREKKNAKDTRVPWPNLPSNIEGAMAILNIGSFNTFVSKVKTADNKKFTYDHTFGKVHYKAMKSRFFLEDKLSLLDDEREWFYEKGTDAQGNGVRNLYVYLPNGREPLAGQLRGKTQTYAFEVKNSTWVTFRNLDFFATTLKAETKDWSNFVDQIHIEHCTFKFPSYSKRMLQAADPKTKDFAVVEWTKLLGIYNGNKKETWGTFTLYNNEFYGSDGVALEYNGRNVKFENNLFEYNDWTAANMKTQMGGMATVTVSRGIYDHYVRNTFRYNGASVGIRPGEMSTVEMNYVTKQCWKVIMNDGSGIHFQKKQQVNGTMQNNWVLDQPKYGLRFDGEPKEFDAAGNKVCEPGNGFRKGKMLYNVVGRCNGMMVKGFEHTAKNNLVFQKQNERDGDNQGGKCALCVLRQVRKNTCRINTDSTTKDNVADDANGGKYSWPIPNSAYNGNENVENLFWNKPANVPGNWLPSQGKGFVQLYFMDPDHNDFRPIPEKATEIGSAGPYDLETTKTMYWIPGRQVEKASMPIPPDNAGKDHDQAGRPKPKVNVHHRNALMWLTALDATSHKVYFCQGKNCNPAYLTETSGELNVASLEGQTITKGQTYRWRVDAHLADTSVEVGDVWSFHT